MKTKATSITLSRHRIQLTNTDKLIYPQDGITKFEVIDYYQMVAPYMLPFMKNRPLVMQRFPDGITGESFYQKNASDYFPAWITTKTIAHTSGGAVKYVVCNTRATLVYLANQSCLTPHLWLSKVNKLRYPDRMIFDLDPSDNNFTHVIKAAKTLRTLLDDHNMPSFVMTTGSRGLHVVVPLKPTASFTKVRAFARQLAEQVVAHNPDYYTLEMRKNMRQKKVFIDYLRNSFGATAVAPYALRAYHKAPIATPLSWDELDSKLSPQKYTITNLVQRLTRHPDPWKDFFDHRAAVNTKKLVDF